MAAHSTNTFKLFQCIFYAILSSNLFSPSQSVLTTLSTGKFQAHPSRGSNVLPETPTLTMLASHANLGSKGGFRFNTGEFHLSPRGLKRVRLIQTYAGLDVFGSTVVAAANDDEVLTGETFGEISQNLKREIRYPNICQRNVKLFQNIAIRREGFKPTDTNIERREGQRIIFSKPDRRAKLAYKIEFFYNNGETVKWPVYFLEACTGVTLLSYDNIKNSTNPQNRKAEQELEEAIQEVENSQNQTIFRLPRRLAGICSPYINGVGGNGKTGKRTYNLEPLCLNMQKSGAFCTMQGTYVKVVDNLNKYDYNKQEVITFPCVAGYRDGINGAFGVANDAFYFGEESGRFFQEKYGMRALPYLPRMVVHYGSQFSNAFWDGTDMYFGDGGSVLYPLVSLDIIAHELAHGITTRNSNLVYRGQSGGINEAFSDITGEATKHFTFGENDWEIGPAVFKTEQAIRYMYDPPKDGRSIRYSWSFRPLMDVHFSSGVFNHAFYVLVTKERMNIYDAFKCYLDANLNLWGPLTNYWIGACNVIQAAYDNGFNHRKVRRSFWRVGLPMFLCKFWRLRASLGAGEERRGVLVRSERSPILEIDTKSVGVIAKPTRVEATAEDGSDVLISVATDNEAENIVATGMNEVVFDANQGEMFVQLFSNQTADVRTTLRVV